MNVGGKDVAALKLELIERYGEEKSDQLYLAKAPGRVNIIGEHTDYNHGYVFPCGLGAHIFLVFRPREDTIVRVWAKDLQEEAQVDLSSIDLPTVPRFMKFIIASGDFMRKHNDDKPLMGFDAVLTSTIPMGGGVSSSSALSVASGLAFTTANPSIELSKDRFLQVICESEWAYSGVRGGIMDQFTSINAQEGRAFVLDCRASAVHPDYDQLRLPDNLAIIIANTNVQHELVGTPYNDRRASCERAAAAVATKFPDRKITHLRDVTLDMLEQSRDSMDDIAFKRATHGVAEDIRTLKCGDALKANDLALVGQLVNESHASLRDIYEVSCKELDAMVDIATQCDGVYGARMMGGGFGGCAIVLAKPEAAEAVKARLEREYPVRCGREAHIFVTRAGQGASVQSC